MIDDRLKARGIRRSLFSVRVLMVGKIKKFCLIPPLRKTGETMDILLEICATEAIIKHFAVFPFF